MNENKKFFEVFNFKQNNNLKRSNNEMNNDNNHNGRKNLKNKRINDKNVNSNKSISLNKTNSNSNSNNGHDSNEVISIDDDNDNDNTNNINDNNNVNVKSNPSKRPFEFNTQIKKRKVEKKNDNRPLHPLFNFNYSGSSSKNSSNENKKAKNKQKRFSYTSCDASLPTNETIHVKPLNEIEYKPLSELKFKRRQKPKVVDSNINSKFNLLSLNDVVNDYNNEDYIPIYKHNENNELFTNMFRPTSSKDVIGNEECVNYLINWIQNLRIGSNKWINVNKKRKERILKKKSYSDDWIVDDDDDDNVYFGYDFDFDYDTDEFVLNNDNSNLPLLENLPNDIESNIIILNGPSGSGKSSSVYACGSELKFEIIELNPGQCKRSNKEIINYIGSVGENHILNKNDRNHYKKNSIILIEECDIIFDDDKGFWNSIQFLSQASKRPIVITCNDISSIPLNNLFYQGILKFKKPSKDIIKDYFDRIGLKFTDNQRELMKYPLVIEDEKIFSLNQFGSLFGNFIDEGYDIRQSLMQAHLSVIKDDRSINKSDNDKTNINNDNKNDKNVNDQTDSLNSLKDHFKQLDLKSYNDCYLEPKLKNILEVSGNYNQNDNHTNPYAVT